MTVNGIANPLGAARDRRPRLSGVGALEPKAASHPEVGANLLVHDGPGFGLKPCAAWIPQSLGDRVGVVERFRKDCRFSCDQVVCLAPLAPMTMTRSGGLLWPFTGLGTWVCGGCA